MTQDGTVIAMVPAGVASDLAGNPNVASTSTDNEVTYDTTLPTDAERSTVSVSSSTVAADGASTATITVTLVDSQSGPLVGQTVSLTADGGSSTISVPSGPSDSQGQVTFTVTNTTPETVTYTATNTTENVAVTQTVTVTFVLLPLPGTTITVTDAGTTEADDGECTLPEAIVAANTNMASGAAPGECAAGTEDDTIVFADGVGAITLTMGWNNGSTGLPAITSALVIDGGDEGVTIQRDPAFTCDDTDADADFRILKIDSSGDVRLRTMTVANGCVVGENGGG